MPLRLQKSAVLSGLFLASLMFPALARSQAIDRYFPASPVHVVVLRADEGTLTCRTGSDDEVHFVLEGSRNGEPVGYYHHFSALRDSMWGDTLFLGLTLRSPTSPFAMFQDAIITLEIPRGMEWSAEIKDGSITGKDLSGYASLRTREGTIHLEDMEGIFRLQTGSGTIYGTDLTGTLDAACDDGNLDLSGRFERVRVRSESGGISIHAHGGSRVASEKGADWSLVTNSGDISLNLPDDLCARFDPHTPLAENFDWGRRSATPDSASRNRPDCGTVHLSSNSGRIRLR